MTVPDCLNKLFLLLLVLAVTTGCARKEEIPSANSGDLSPGPGIADVQPHTALEGQMGEHPASSVMEEINAYKARLKADPQDLEALIGLGNANFDIQRFGRASELYQQVLEIDPHDIRVRTDLASSLRNIGEIHAAIDELENVLALSPEHETALYNIGVIRLNNLQDLEGALTAWEKLMQAHPDVVYAPELEKRMAQLREEVLARGEEGDSLAP